MLMFPPIGFWLPIPDINPAFPEFPWFAWLFWFPNPLKPDAFHCLELFNNYCPPELKLLLPKPCCPPPLLNEGALNCCWGWGDWLNIDCPELFLGCIGFDPCGLLNMDPWFLATLVKDLPSPLPKDIAFGSNLFIFALLTFAWFMKEFAVPNWFTSPWLP